MHLCIYDNVWLSFAREYITVIRLSMDKDIESETTDIDRASLTRHISLFSMQSFGNIGASHITTNNASFFLLWWSLWQRLRALIRISIPTTLKFIECMYQPMFNFVELCRINVSESESDKIQANKFDLIRSIMSHSDKWWRQCYQLCFYDDSGTLQFNRNSFPYHKASEIVGLKKCMMISMVVFMVIFPFCEMQAHILNTVQCCNRLPEIKLAKLYGIIAHHKASMNWYISTFGMTITPLLIAMYTHCWWATVPIINRKANVMFA